MSTQRKPEFVEEQVSEEAVHEYLEAHPDFFERHGSLLSRLELPHGTGGTVSLVERQVSVLRQKELKLQRQLKELINVARDNDVLSSKIHQLTLQLLSAADLQSCVSAIEEAMRSGFGADHSILVLFADPTMFDDINGGRFFRVVDRKDKALGPFDTFLEGKGPRCGQVRDSQKNFLFQDDAEEIGSVALVPLGDKADLGFLAIGSHDADRFHPGMSIDFLARVGDLIAGALKRY
ncbi:MAG: DUF484 family protein [Woeseiaceae bacterium]|jgi:uncharacterized protein YigA (DUF484 family)